MKKFIIWWKGRFLGYRLWRVYYPDINRQTYLLPYEEAKSLAETFKGVLTLDYEADY